MSERRTKEDWGLLVAMHRGYYPLVDNQPMNGGQGFRRTRPQQTEPGEDGRPPDNRHPMERALEHLTKTFPLNTPAWASWSASMQPAKLAGKWAISGYQAGKGPIVGQVTISADPSAPDSFNDRDALRHRAHRRSGESRTARRSSTPASSGAAAAACRAATTSGARSMFVERDWREMSGRWFTGAYDEIGIDVKLVRLGSRAGRVRHRTSRRSRRRRRRAPVKIYGANLPASVKAGGHRVRPGRQGHARRQRAAATSSPSRWTSPRTRRSARGIVSVAGTVKPAALVVYDQIDGIKVLPQAGHGARRRRGLPEAAPAVRGDWHAQRSRRQAGHGRRSQPRHGRREVVAGGIHCHLRRRRHCSLSARSTTRGCSRPTSTGRTRKRSGNRNNVGDVWVVAELIRTTGAGERRSRSARARTCW